MRTLGQRWASRKGNDILIGLINSLNLKWAVVFLCELVAFAVFSLFNTLDGFMSVMSNFTKRMARKGYENVVLS